MGAIATCNMGVIAIAHMLAALTKEDINNIAVSAPIIVPYVDVVVCIVHQLVQYHLYQPVVPHGVGSKGHGDVIIMVIMVIVAIYIDSMRDVVVTVVRYLKRDSE